MRTKLLQLYSSKTLEFDTVRSSITNAKVNGPFLMSPNKKYAKQPKKLLIVGQETKGWENIKDLSKQMSIYEGFNLGSKYYASPFWNVMRKVERVLKNEQYSSAWTNISKFDVDAKRPIGLHEEIISKLDYLLNDEIKILNPVICLFFTSHNFDHRLKKVLPGLEFNEVANFKKSILCKLQHPDLPEHSYRTYHPNYLRKSRNEKRFLEFIKTI